MTRDEVRELIRDSVRDGIKTQYEKRPMSHDDEFLQAIAEAVLAAFAARGLIIGELAELTDDESAHWNDVMDDCDHITQLAECFDGRSGTNLALVRVVE